MNENKLIYVDFKNKVKISDETINSEIQKPKRLDPVLERVKNELDENNFEIYQKVVDDWMRRCFEYEMEMKNKKDD